MTAVGAASRAALRTSGSLYVIASLESKLSDRELLPSPRRNGSVSAETEAGCS